MSWLSDKINNAKKWFSVFAGERAKAQEPAKPKSTTPAKKAGPGLGHYGDVWDPKSQKLYTLDDFETKIAKPVDVKRNAQPSTADIMAAYALERQQKAASYEKVLAELLQGIGNMPQFKWGKFNEAGARQEAGREFNPYFDKMVTNTNTDWDLTKKELQGKRESIGITGEAQTNQLTNELAGQNMVRSGLGARRLGLAKLANINQIEGVNNEEQIGKNNYDRTLDDLGQKRKQAIREDIEYRRGIFSQNENNRYSKYNQDLMRYNNARTAAANKAKLRVYGG